MLLPGLLSFFSLNTTFSFFDNVVFDHQIGFISTPKDHTYDYGLSANHR